MSKQEMKQDDLRFISKSDDEELYFKAWEQLEESSKKRLAIELWQDRIAILITDYNRKNINDKVKVLETLAFIHEKEAVDFLVEALKSQDEILRLAAAVALKKQEPLLILEPMLDALSKPEIFLAARVYDVLSEVGVFLVPLILKKLPDSLPDAKTVMIQLLGAFGDESVADNIHQATREESYNVRKAACEAYSELGGEKSGDYLIEYLTDPNWQIRLAAVQGLKKQKCRKAQSALKKACLNEQDKTVKSLMQSLLNEWDNGEIITIAQWSRK